ncbi:MAG: diaminopimelate epimerase [Candidatus Omnitrophica bacterium]|nr:diaminopimelate epimerase [Candidatus Omnitrophota bacterium]
MKKIPFVKAVGSGNDFVIVDRAFQAPLVTLRALARNICDRTYGVGADGLLLLEKSARADVRMRIFNADGSEAQMCGNGARCAAFYLASKLQATNCRLKIKTKAGIVQAEVKGEVVKIRLTDPVGLKFNIPLRANKRTIHVNFINTGVPHAVIFVEGLAHIAVNELGRAIRYHRRFAPAGTNVNFVEVSNAASIRVRTYERGVEAETCACGTGSVAAALIFVSICSVSSPVIRVQTQGGEILKVYFKKEEMAFKDIWLEGNAKIVHKGEYYV